ncbi:MAG: hypothetical protein BroJett025_09740 [Patescibacteria group bacterium]|nr:MAG: hypothetical protein BroJett025_09740 [Patescibacteria group bacterium]
MVETKRQVRTRENPYLALNGADRLAALKTASQAVEANPNPTNTEKQNYADSVVAIQHLLADRSVNPQTQQKPEEVAVFSDLFTVHVKIMAQKNIYLPLEKERVIPEQQNFRTYVTEIQGILTELKQLKDVGKQPDKDQSQRYVDILASFQRFLTNKYNSDINRDDFPLIEASLKLFSATVNTLATFGIKMSVGKEFVVEQPETKNTEDSEKQEAGILDTIKQKFPEFSQRVQQFVAAGIERYQAHQAEKLKRDLEKRKQKFLADAQKAKKEQEAKKQAEEQRQQKIIDALQQSQPGDVIQLFDTKSRLIESHTIVKKHEDRQLLEADIHNHQTGKTLENRNKHFSHYTDLDNATTVQVVKQKKKEKPVKKELDWKTLVPGSSTLDNQVVKQAYVFNTATNQQELRNFSKANQDDLGYAQVKDYRDPNKPAMRYFLADGAGGSSSVEDSAKVKASMREFIRQAIWAGKSLRESSFLAANHIYELIKDQNRPDLLGYGAFVAAEVLEEKIDICWTGDPAAILWKSGKPFAHRRSNYKDNNNIRGKASQFQMQNFVENQVNWLHAAEPTGDDSRKTMMLDKHELANVIRKAIGDRKLKNEDSISHFELSKQEVINSGAEFLLLLCDGAQPSNMIAMDSGNPYNKRVNEIMKQLSEGKLNVNEAAQQITQASRTINQDEDDISVMIVDLREWKAT